MGCDADLNDKKNWINDQWVQPNYQDFCWKILDNSSAGLIRTDLCPALREKLFKKNKKKHGQWQFISKDELLNAIHFVSYKEIYFTKSMDEQLLKHI